MKILFTCLSASILSVFTFAQDKSNLNFGHIAPEDFVVEIPAGYVADELPKSVKVGYKGNEGFFKYVIQKDESRIQFRSHLKLNEMAYSAEDYNSLRDFFAFVLKKYSEQIVLRRKK